VTAPADSPTTTTFVHVKAEEDRQEESDTSSNDEDLSFKTVQSLANGSGGGNHNHNQHATLGKSVVQDEPRFTWVIARHQQKGTWRFVKEDRYKQWLRARILQRVHPRTAFFLRVEYIFGKGFVARRHRHQYDATKLGCCLRTVRGKVLGTS
jgi:hypothetical protein